jgi:uncharacterized protein (TIGR01777 family)
MRVIIAGGTGLIGGALAKSMAADGHEVIVLSRSPERNKGDLPKGVRAEKWDGRTAQGWGKLVEGAGAVVNLAGDSIAGANPVVGRWTKNRKRSILESRINATKALVEAIQQAATKPGVLLQGSAVGYYGSRGDERLPETAGPGNDFLAGVCKQWEAASAPVESMGVRRVVFRTAPVYSRRPGGALDPLKLLTFFGVFGPMGSGKQYWPWIHEADHIGGMRFLIDSGASGAFNLCAPQTVRQKDFAKTMGKVMRRPAFIPTPAFALRLMAGELADGLLLCSQNQAPEALSQLGFKWKFGELEPALRDLLK